MNNGAQRVLDPELLRRICGEFLEMPGLRLTRAQAQRLWGLDDVTCSLMLDFLVDTKFLQVNGANTYSRLTDGPAMASKLRTAKAEMSASAVRRSKSADR